MVDRDKYRQMGDHDILVEVAVKQEILTEKVDKACEQIGDHETRLSKREALCDEARKTLFNEVGRLRGYNGNQKRSRKEKAAIGSGTFSLIAAIIYAIGKAAGWW